MNKDHVEKSLNKIRVMFERTSERIESMKSGEKIAATKLVAEIAQEFGLTGPALYPILLYVIRDYPGVEITRGAHGGVKKL